MTNSTENLNCTIWDILKYLVPPQQFQEIKQNSTEWEDIDLAEHAGKFNRLYHNKRLMALFKVHFLDPCDIDLWDDLLIKDEAGIEAFLGKYNDVVRAAVFLADSSHYDLYGWNYFCFLHFAFNDDDNNDLHQEALRALAASHYSNLHVWDFTERFIPLNDRLLATLLPQQEIRAILSDNQQMLCAIKAFALVKDIASLRQLENAVPHVYDSAMRRYLLGEAKKHNTYNWIMEQHPLGGKSIAVKFSGYVDKRDYANAFQLFFENKEKIIQSGDTHQVKDSLSTLLKVTLLEPNINFMHKRALLDAYIDVHGGIEQAVSYLFQPHTHAHNHDCLRAVMLFLERVDRQQYKTVLNSYFVELCKANDIFKIEALLRSSARPLIHVKEAIEKIITYVKNSHYPEGLHVPYSLLVVDLCHKDPIQSSLSPEILKFIGYGLVSCARDMNIDKLKRFLRKDYDPYVCQEGINGAFASINDHLAPRSLPNNISIQQHKILRLQEKQANLSRDFKCAPRDEKILIMQELDKVKESILNNKESILETQTSINKTLPFIRKLLERHERLDRRPTFLPTWASRCTPQPQQPVTVESRML
ncbi:MAG: hypothetical protein IPP74_10495 [Alphaproteobacteria bacterium]|nr:hypothetical protein [Alphaproteobacteria bacterium]